MTTLTLILSTIKPHILSNQSPQPESMISISDCIGPAEHHGNLMPFLRNLVDVIDLCKCHLLLFVRPEENDSKVT